MSPSPTAGGSGLRGKVVVVTGGSRGLGRALAIGFGSAGANVVISGRDEAALAEVGREVESAGGRALLVASDLLTPAGAETLALASLGWKDRVDVLVNNAGCTAAGPFEASTDAEWERLFAINLMAPVRLCRHLGDAMRRAGGGSIINMSSALGSTAFPNVSPYIASKGALEQFTRALALEWARYHIRVNAIAPGFIATELLGDGSDAMNRYVERRTPMRRMGRPEEVVGAALYLGSDASSYVTGSVLAVDGGWTAA